METDYFAELIDVISTHGLIGNRGINMQVQAHKRSQGEYKRGERIWMIERERENEKGGGIREVALLVSENWSDAVVVLGTEESRRSCIPR